MNKTRLSLAVAGSLMSGAVFAQGPAVEAMLAEVVSYQPTQVVVAKMEAQEHANLTARVSGYLLSQNFEDGAMVEAGDVLFEIDPTPYLQAFNIATAQKQQADAALTQAQTVFKRVKELQGAGGAAQSNLDEATAALKVTQAGVAAANAALDKATDDLEYTKVRAPYAGRLGKARFSVGDMVAPAAGPMIDLVQLHPMNATFNLAYEQFLEKRMHDAGAMRYGLQGTDLQGELTFIDNKINPTSGTISLSATFTNEDAAFVPNQVVRVEMTPSQGVEGVWIPQAATGQDLNVQFAYVIVDGKAERRDIEVLERVGKDVFVTSGIAQGEQVITNGLIRVRAGVPVTVAQ
ncbi:efflux RND transporter periplasmic adaptor subunit [Thaumasiovibrio subtropicus]|uniref:efflux RND transporter periplasmic adaptor subunit n=1 Tax=Thaumasiovibrio subtropicus TaxID=1891207 RepID=UPI000B357967|nr:efflux RND transporter periplasmic adaptor subunit [Thaumasiovibrio subtropicus]